MEEEGRIIGVTQVGMEAWMQPECRQSSSLPLSLPKQTAGALTAT